MPAAGLLGPAEIREIAGRLGVRPAKRLGQNFVVDPGTVRRIVALADVFDALTHERPYKDAWPVRDAVAEIRRLEGRQFDPAVVEAFLRLGPEKLVTLPNPNLSQRHLKSLAPVA